MNDCPMIVTACFDEATQLWLDDLRQRYFPAGRTVVGAHLTLFHAIAPPQHAVLRKTVEALCARQTRFAVQLPSLRSLGRGVAIAIESATLRALRREMAAPLRAHLTPQDTQPFAPHVTLANKMLPDEARALLQNLRATWVPRQGTIERIALWDYIGPQWRLATQFTMGS